MSQKGSVLTPVQITDENILKTRSQEEISQDLQIIIKRMLSEANIGDNGSKMIVKISNIVPEIKREIYETYKKALTSPDNLAILQDKVNVTKKLIALINTLDNELSPELLNIIFEFKFENQLTEDIVKIIKAFPITIQKEAKGQALHLIEEIIDNSSTSKDVKMRALGAVPYMIEENKEALEQVLLVIKKITNDHEVSNNLKQIASDYLTSVLNANREESKIIKSIIGDNSASNNVEGSTLYAVPFILETSKEKDQEKISKHHKASTLFSNPI